MNLLTDEQRRKLLHNGKLRRELERSGKVEADFYPVVKLHVPECDMTWLLTELYPDDPDVAFGLCDLGMGFPELGDVRISELLIRPRSQWHAGSARSPVQRRQNPQRVCETRPRAPLHRSVRGRSCNFPTSP